MNPLPLSVRLAALRQQLDADLERIADLPAVRRRQPVLDALRADLGDVLDQEEGGAVVCLVGSTGAGKSTLINALAGRAIARSGDSRPTTTIPTIYVPEDADPARDRREPTVGSLTAPRAARGRRGHFCPKHDLSVWRPRGARRRERPHGRFSTSPGCGSIFLKRSARSDIEPGHRIRCEHVL